MRESTLRQEAIRQLLSFGYKRNDIYSEYIIQNKYRVDLLIKSNDQPYLLVEVKLLDVPNKPDSDYFKFHPAVKQIQTYANTVKAPFFAIFAENGFNWFTGDNKGRPELLSNPVKPAIENEKSYTNRNEIISVLQEFKNYFTHYVGASSIEQVGLMLYAQTLDELNQPLFKRQLIEGENPNSGFFFPFETLNWEKEVLEELFSKLDRIRFTQVDVEDLLLAIDKVFNQARQSLFVPRWLSDFMIKLGQVQSSEKVIDLSSSHGNIISALLLNFPTHDLNSIVSTFSYLQSEHWLKFQELVITGKELFHYKVNNAHPDISSFIQNVTTAKVFIAPIFGGKFSFYSELTGESLTDNLEILLEQAISLVQAGSTIIFIAPEGFLFSNKFKRARNQLQQFGSIDCIISLPSGTFEPYSGLKTSLIIFEKLHRAVDHTFIGILNQVPPNDRLNSEDILSVKEIFNNYQNWKRGVSFENTNQSFLFPYENLDFKNISTAYQFLEKTEGKSESFLSYPLINISKLIRRGTPIKLVENGNIPVIGPKAVRELAIDVKGFGLTNRENIEGKAVTVQKDDILLNAISTYKGEAALVEEENSNIVISQHVILIRPDKEIIYPEYLTIVLNGKLFKKQLDQITSGAVITFVPVNLLREIVIPIPPKEIQYQIVQKIKEAQIRLQEFETSLKNAKTEFDNLLNNINGEDYL